MREDIKYILIIFLTVFTPAFLLLNIFLSVYLFSQIYTSWAIPGPDTGCYLPGGNVIVDDRPMPTSTPSQNLNLITEYPNTIDANQLKEKIKLYTLNNESVISSTESIKEESGLYWYLDTPANEIHLIAGYSTRSGIYNIYNKNPEQISPELYSQKKELNLIIDGINTKGYLLSHKEPYTDLKKIIFQSKEKFWYEISSTTGDKFEEGKIILNSIN